MDVVVGRAWRFLLSGSMCLPAVPNHQDLCLRSPAKVFPHGTPKLNSTPHVYFIMHITRRELLGWIWSTAVESFLLVFYFVLVMHNVCVCVCVCVDPWDLASLIAYLSPMSEVVISNLMQDCAVTQRRLRLHGQWIKKSLRGTCIEEPPQYVIRHTVSSGSVCACIAQKTGGLVKNEIGHMFLWQCWLGLYPWELWSQHWKWIPAFILQHCKCYVNIVIYVNITLNILTVLLIPITRGCGTPTVLHFADSLRRQRSDGTLWHCLDPGWDSILHGDETLEVLGP